LPYLLQTIDLVSSSTSFLFNGKYYEQIYGSLMGSPLSPILVVIMEDLETQSLQKLDFEIHTYYRYVDDLFMIIPKTKLDMAKMKPGFRLRSLTRGSWAGIESGRGKERSKPVIS